MKSAFIAFKNKNYQLWFTGQLFSLFGTWMQSTALGYLVFELTHSPKYLGYVAFISGLPVWFFILHGGVIADRVSRRNLLITTQTILMALSLILTVATFSGVIKVWHIIILSFFVGVATAFETPARQAFVSELVSKEQLTNAIALNSIMFNLATTISPALGGIIYALKGPQYCFLINTISYISIISSLAFIKIVHPSNHSNSSTISEISEGLKYVFLNSEVRKLIFLLAVVTLCVVSFFTLIPAWAVKILHGDAKTAGFIQGSRGFGAFLSGLLLASLNSPSKKILIRAAFMLPLFLFLLPLGTITGISILIFMCIGATLMLVLNLINAILQTNVDDKLRGRLMSIHGLTFFGLMPIGGLFAGYLGEFIGEKLTSIVLACLITVFLIFIKIPQSLLWKFKNNY